MSTPPVIHRLKRSGAGLLFLFAAMAAATSAFSQTEIVGHTSVWNGTAPTSAYPFLSWTNTNTVIVVPFAFESLGDYTVTSTSLLLRAVPLYSGNLPADDPENPGRNQPPDSGSGAAAIDLGNVSIRIFSTLPTSLALPPSLVSYAMPSLGVAQNPTVYLCATNSAPPFTAGQTYYLAVSINASSTLEWDMTTGDSSSGPYPGDTPVTSLVGNGTSLAYYQITSGGVQSFYGNAGGFAIAANAVSTPSSVPEPAAGGAILGSGVLALAWFARRRRLR